MKTKTAMQDLIDKWRLESSHHIPNAPIYQKFIEDAKQLLEKEKEQIMDAYWNGNSDGHIGENYISEYYNETYKQD